MKTIDLSHALRDGYELKNRMGAARLTLHDLGELVLPTGQVVACDPFVVSKNEEPFTVRVRPGRYPVSVNVARFDSDDQRVAYSILRLSDAAPVRWEMALLPGQSADGLKDDEFHGYGVDSGTGCFMDVEAARILAVGSNWENEHHEALEEMNKTYVHTWAWVNTVLDPARSANVVAFSSGYGDGTYPSYWGYDANGQVACLVTDFGVFYEEEDA
jgi:Protein of unknown function (DUF4241)